MKKLILLAFAASSLAVSAQEQRHNKKDGPFVFTVVKDISTTEVENQYRSSTCWTFSSLSFFESELIRMGKGRLNLSEMYVVRNTYADKADKYVRMQGKVNFGPGGAFHDVMNCLRNHGLVPEEVYPTTYMDGTDKPKHGELDEVTKAFLDALIKLPNGKLTNRWKPAFDGILDAYLGKIPQNFTYQGKNYTPASFSKDMGLNADDYVEITSFTHHDPYTRFVLEVPDNWNADLVYNLPLDEFARTIEQALMNGYTVAWAADVSEKYFSFKEGVAFVPEKDYDDMTKEEKEKLFDGPKAEKKITPELRQAAFNDQSTQDDHGMHIVGIVKDQNGTRYYIVKNSWGTEGNDAKGYFYASEAYVLYKTTGIMVHKKAVPSDIAKKLGIK